MAFFVHPDPAVAPFELLYEDADLFVVQKPSGLHTVDLPHSPAPSLAALLLAAAPALRSVAERPGDAGLVQRLDYETSGCVLGATGRTVWAQLRAALQAGRIEKQYLAIVEGCIEPRVEVGGWIGSRYRRAQKVHVYADRPPKRALPAHSCFELLAYQPEEDLALVRASAPTARRHQIRAHLSRLGHPLVGDRLYGSTRSLPLPGSPPFLLHASTVSLLHPVRGTALRVTAPPPAFIETMFGAAALQTDL